MRSWIDSTRVSNYLKTVVIAVLNPRVMELASLNYCIDIQDKDYLRVVVLNLRVPSATQLINLANYIYSTQGRD